MYNYVLVIIEILLLHARDAKKPHATPRALCIGCAVPGAPLPTSPHRFPDGTNNEGYVKRTSFSTRKWHRSCGCHRRNGATGVERRLSSIIRYIIPIETRVSRGLACPVLSFLLFPHLSRCSGKFDFCETTCESVSRRRSRGCHWGAAEVCQSGITHPSSKRMQIKILRTKSNAYVKTVSQDVLSLELKQHSVPPNSRDFSTKGTHNERYSVFTNSDGIHT